MSKYSYCHVAQRTDVGCKRKANEDWLATFECDNGLVAVVCDGMGGHVGGAVASHLAVETIQQFLTSTRCDDPRKAIIEAIDRANKALLRHTEKHPELAGMGSTCVMLIVRDGRVWMGSVGDSRIYLVRQRAIKQLTKDQSYVQTLVDSGQITPEQAEHHPRKNEILNAIGLKTMQPATVLAEPIIPQAGDCFVLCSDGLSGMVPDNEILAVVSRQADMSQQQRVDTLVQMARNAGGLDNITCQIVEFSIAPDDAITQPTAPAVAQPITQQQTLNQAPVPQAPVPITINEQAPGAPSTPAPEVVSQAANAPAGKKKSHRWAWLGIVAAILGIAIALFMLIRVVNTRSPHSEETDTVSNLSTQANMKQAPTAPAIPVVNEQESRRDTSTLGDENNKEAASETLKPQQFSLSLEKNKQVTIKVSNGHGTSRDNIIFLNDERYRFTGVEPSIQDWFTFSLQPSSCTITITKPQAIAGAGKVITLKTSQPGVAITLSLRNK